METNPEAGAAVAGAAEFLAASDTPQFATPPETARRETDKNLVDDLITVVERAPKGIVMTPEHATKQRAVLENLPKDLIEQVRGYLYAGPIERKRVLEVRYHMKISDEEVLRDDTQVIRGLLHEMLVEAEGNLRGSTEVSKEILSALQNPERYSTVNNTVIGDALKGRSSPDTARAEVKEKGNVVISLTYEAKKANLDLRAAQQLGPYGVIESCEILAETLNRADAQELRNLGFLALARAREHFDEMVERGDILPASTGLLPDFISVSPDFLQVVVVPAEKNIQDPTKLIAGDVTGDARAEFVSLMGNTKRVRFVRSAFSTQQENAAADYIRERIYEKEKNNPKFQTSAQTMRTGQPITEK